MNNCEGIMGWLFGHKWKKVNVGTWGTWVIAIMCQRCGSEK